MRGVQGAPDPVLPNHGPQLQETVWGSSSHNCSSLLQKFSRVCTLPQMSESPQTAQMFLPLSEPRPLLSSNSPGPGVILRAPDSRHQEPPGTTCAGMIFIAELAPYCQIQTKIARNPSQRLRSPSCPSYGLLRSMQVWTTGLFQYCVSRNKSVE